VVLLDPAGRVLLFRLAPDRDPSGRGYWYLPGGGIRPRETVEAAAVRELREETGIRDVTVGAIIGERAGVRFSFFGRDYVQDEWYVAARVTTARVGTGRHGDGERRAIEAHRWWTPDELAASDEVAHPTGLVELVEAAQRG
jgi:ADP-ribose pyrophosphatase YjhB (NUDIX family)